MKNHRNRYSFYDKNDSFEVSVFSTVGDREDQQDSSGLVLRNNEGIITVADGMGGAEGGRPAADIAVKSINDRYESFECIEDFTGFFIETVKQSDYIINNLKNEKGEKMGAGSTVVSVALRDCLMNWISVGDSRIYLCRNNKLTQLTKDHNYLMALNEGVACGEIGPEEYEKEKAKGEALISYLGIGNLKLVDTNREPYILEKDDIVLLSSDGLYKTLDSETIETILNNFRNINEAADALERKCARTAQKNNIIRDNTTFAIIKKL